MARECGAQVVVGLGGGSSMDTAKAVAVEATHEGSCWDYLFFKKAPSERTLPVIAVSTTSGTGSQTTPCAVVTNAADHDKSALWHPNLFAKVAVVDPELVVSLPPSMTAQTGFDAFAHCFEAFLSNGTNPYVRILALEGMRLVAGNLRKAMDDGSDLDARAAMAWADTLGGLAISSGGVTLPHGLGMQVGGHCPHVSHGQALAAIYPEFTRFTWSSAVDRFAEAGRILDPSLRALPDEAAAEASCGAIDGFLRSIGLWIGFSALGVPRDALARIAADGQKLPDYRNNPRIATLEDMAGLMERCWRRTD
jgi:alcohol dehydrogenase class IV